MYKSEIKTIEDNLNIKLPEIYKQFLSEEIKFTEVYEIHTRESDNIYLYNFKDIIERNETYAIQDTEPDYLLIGQDGDLGYFINIKNNSDLVYSLDLGALGNMDMNEEAKDIYKLRC